MSNHFIQKSAEFLVDTINLVDSSEVLTKDKHVNFRFMNEILTLIKYFEVIG